MLLNFNTFECTFNFNLFASLQITLQKKMILRLHACALRGRSSLEKPIRPSLALAVTHTTRFMAQPLTRIIWAKARGDHLAALRWRFLPACCLWQTARIWWDLCAIPQLGTMYTDFGQVLVWCPLNPALRCFCSKTPRRAQWQDHRAIWPRF